ncbi:MAG: DNA polymerase III subunit chi [Alphaproteobacteria bacterium]|nr:DNA polymerase III subunit chi [Alphaproteobacteria bacterium]
MTQIDFYHLQKQTLDQVLPKLIEKAYATKATIKIKVGNEVRVDFINSLLWAYNEESFIPHGSKKDGFAKEQPIWLSAEDDNPNQASLLFLVDGANISLETAKNYERIFNIFDGNDEAALQQARAFWKEISATDFSKNYFQQDDAGRWNKKA